jgi:hypothetical protein
MRNSRSAPLNWRRRHSFVGPESEYLPPSGRRPPWRASIRSSRSHLFVLSNASDTFSRQRDKTSSSAEDRAAASARH